MHELHNVDLTIFMVYSLRLSENIYINEKSESKQSLKNACIFIYIIK